ncbi:phage major capsid protein [Nonomuraea endophytica]|uniref:phage major capsid protein n=1 Tax=Nonomuraea endophytica TaxID=714136 RepID=UPI0037C9A24D
MMAYSTHGHWIGHGEPPADDEGKRLVARCGGPALCQLCAQEAASEAFHAAAGRPGPAAPAEDAQLCPTCGHPHNPDAPAGRRVTETVDAGAVTEAMIDGQLSYADRKDLVRAALCERIKAAGSSSYGYVWVYVNDMTDSAVVYADMGDVLYQCSYAIDSANAVTLGEPTRVVRTYAPDPAVHPVAAGPGTTDLGEGAEVVETREQITTISRVVEAKGTAADGGRIFRVRIIAYGDSKNGRRYPESVMRAAVPLYEGAKAFNHHRTEEELKTGTIAGLVGAYRSVEAATDGLYADLHLLPSCTHAAEALDASLAAQKDGLDPVIGLSHDVMAVFKPTVEGGRRLQEATAITRVHSADLVSDPAAGGKADRVLAGGIDAGAEPENTQEEDTVPTKDEVLAALREASTDELAALGLTKAVESKPDDKPVETPPAPPVPAVKAVEAGPAGTAKGSYLGKLMISGKIQDAGLPVAVVESVTAGLPEQITEAEVDAAITSLKTTMAVLERADLAPKTTVQVTQEARDKKIKALDAFFDGRHSEGYHSFKQAYCDMTGYVPRSWDEDVNRQIMRESIGGLYDSGMRAEESLTTTSWAQVLGDSITRRMMTVYVLPSLQSWRRIVSSIVPVNDFRTQRVGRVGGYGVLPTVNEGAPYQPLTSPPDEEATYALNKRGGTEDLTFEMIANDDVRAISNIPGKLGRAAAQTLFRFVWDMIRTNPATTYDGVPLFHASHGNLGSAALSETSLAAARVAMAEQVAYGDATEYLDLTPRILVVPPALEDIAFKLTTSAVSVGGASADAEQSRTAPNLHQGMETIKLPFLTSDDNDWYTFASPQEVNTIEIGFYGGRQDPELFTQTDPSQGSMFNADKMTWKIRHMYSGVALDHRGMYAGKPAGG